MKSNIDKFLGLKAVKEILGDISPTVEQKLGIEKYFEKYGYRKSQDRYTRLSHFITNNVVDFIAEEKRLCQYERMSEDYFCILYGTELGKMRWQDHRLKTKKGRPNCKEYWINRGYTEDESYKMITEHQKKMSIRSSKNRDHKKFSIRCIEYWIENGATITEAEELVSNAQKRDIAFYIKKYGEDLGIEKYNYSCNKRKKNLGK